MATERVLTNAKVVLADQLLSGTVVVRDGLIAEIADGPAIGEDFGGDFLLPGLVELHTDNLESHYEPRPGVRWNAIAALQAHDAEVVTSGITTVCDALRIGMVDESEMKASDMRTLRDAIHTGIRGQRLRAEHLIHLRCEVSSEDALPSFREYEQDPLVRVVSLMDHAPGQRQFPTYEAALVHFRKAHKMSDAEFEVFYERRVSLSRTYADRYRNEIASLARSHGKTLASHDDATAAHVEESRALGSAIAEFPTTLVAAEASRAAGLKILMGAPNIVRGSSHSGNISARELATHGLLDIVSSDYIPFSLIQAPFILAGTVPSVGLPQAVAMVTRNPAAAIGLDNRGEIAVGKRADLVRVRLQDAVPMVRTVWRAGERVA